MFTWQCMLCPEHCVTPIASEVTEFAKLHNTIEHPGVKDESRGYLRQEDRLF